MASHFRKLVIKDIRQETADCISIAFEIPKEWQNEFQFKQGQNITLKAIIGNDETRRSYSICSSPLDNELRVAVKKVANGKFSEYANQDLKKGSQLEVLPPTGKFYIELNPANSRHYIAFAAGSGITPVISIIKTSLAIEPKSSFTLIYGNRNRSSIIFKEALESLKNKYIERFTLHHILSREKTDAPINYGRITADKCSELSKKLIDIRNTDEFFICGPEEMIFSIKNFLENAGVDRKKIHFELFTVPGENTAYLSQEKLLSRNQKLETGNQHEKISKVTVKLDGIAFDFDLAYNSESILDAALRQGADLPFSCKGGVCCTCKAKLIQGTVSMDVNWGLEQDELDANFILTCQSHPTTERVVIDYDLR